MHTGNDKQFMMYFSGTELIGDNFSKEQIQEWFDDEAEGYATLGSKNKEQYRYVYHALNKMHGYSKLKKNKYKNVLGFGSAYGHEFFPITDRIEHITIIDPSKYFKIDEINGVTTTYKSPGIQGDLPIFDNSIDLLTCFGVLHHVPNVSYLVQEFGRVLSVSGIAIIREPVVNMGDWRYPRKGLTKRERGIPEHIMDIAIAKAGLKIVAKIPCDFPIVSKLSKFIGVAEPYNSNFITALDAALSKIFFWNTQYNRKNLFGKICPCSVYWIIKKTS